MRHRRGHGLPGAGELADDPRGELSELTGIYVDKGLSPRLAAQVARELTAHDPLAAHASHRAMISFGTLMSLRKYSTAMWLPAPARLCYMLHIVSVGVRELRQSASELLRRVEQGETFEITDRGRPVAILGPLPAGGPLTQMLVSGQIDEASSDLDDLPDPIALPRGAEAPSRVLARLRRAER